jgi:hypothetical protein
VFDLPGIFSITVFLAALSTCLVAWNLSKILIVAAALTATVSVFV